MDDFATTEFATVAKFPVGFVPSPELCIVVPTFNERDNIEPLVDGIATALAGIHWELIFVDDNSPDDTAKQVRLLGQVDRRVRCIKRVGRRGLSSAVIEGMLATSAPYVGVMDGDLQHDEGVLSRMLDILKGDPVDLVVATRYSGTGKATGLSSPGRELLSRLGVRLARMLIRSDITDPVSGFFMLRREVIDSVATRLSGIGTKILIDILASAPQPLSVAELPYHFRSRGAGESKLDAATGLEYLILLADRLCGRYLPGRMLLFGMVGASGILVYLVMLGLLLRLQIAPVAAAAAATIVAMISNFFLNNFITYRDCRLSGWRALRGLLSFVAVCSVGAGANVAIFRDIYAMTGMWLLAGAVAAMVSALLNYSLSSIFTWGSRH